MRSVSQIYSEAVSTRNNYLQLTELNTGRSNSKLSMLNLLRSEEHTSELQSQR